MDKIGFLKLTFDGTKSLASRFLFSAPPSEKILDPMSTIVRLAILSYMDKGTKVSIHNNSLGFQPPDYLQVPLRWGYGDDRMDLHNLHNPISKSLDWYDLKIEYVRHLFSLAKEGIDNLNECYKSVTESNVVCHSLTYYSKLIELEIKRSTTSTEEERQALPNINLNEMYNELDSNVYNHSGITKLKDYWTYNELKLISEMFKIVDEYRTRGDNLDSILGAINKIVVGKDERVQDLIIKLTTTLTN